MTTHTKTKYIFSGETPKLGYTATQSLLAVQGGCEIVLLGTDYQLTNEWLHIIFVTLPLPPTLACDLGRCPWNLGGVTKLVSFFRPSFSFFVIDDFLFRITFMFDRCHRSYAAGTPVKYECDSKDLDCYFLHYKSPPNERTKLSTPTPGIHVDPIPHQYITALALFTLWES